LEIIGWYLIEEWYVKVEVETNLVYVDFEASNFVEG
jgi:hypothetical protein